MNSPERVPADVCRIHLVRHGRTVMNVSVRFRGRLDVPLDEVGRAEAREAAGNLRRVPLAAVYTSPLERAKEVAREIAAASSLAPVTVDEGLTNLDYGRWEGLTKDECRERDADAFRLYAEDPMRARCPEGEALAEGATRVVSALLGIGKRHAGQEVAAVTHGAMVRLAVLYVEGVAPGDWQFKLPTGSATVFEVREGALSVVSVADRTTPDPFKASARSVAPA
jgi:ribonuclease H / adenosylcobalamin/alpha-ribazole phosphatase